MRFRNITRLTGLGLLLLSGNLSAAKAQSTQSMVLDPGWNAIHLTIDPRDPSPAAVFAGLPIEMVWGWTQPGSPVEFVENVAEAPFNQEGWNVYLPASNEKSFLSDLFAIKANRCYLVKLGGGTQRTLAVSGRPSYRKLKWVADSFNLVGFPITAGTSLSVGAMFSNEPALKDQQVFRLDPSGTWTRVYNSQPLRRGEAYWVYCSGASQFNGWLELELRGDGLDFGDQLETRDVVLHNRSPWPMDVAIANPGGLPISRNATATDGSTEWRALAGASIPLGADESARLVLGIQRAGLEVDLSGMITFSATGNQIPVAVDAELATSTEVSVDESAGLWAGVVILNQVTEANSSDPMTPRSTPAEFSMRLILHVDAAGEKTVRRHAAWQCLRCAP